MRMSWALRNMRRTKGQVERTTCCALPKAHLARLLLFKQLCTATINLAISNVFQCDAPCLRFEPLSWCSLTDVHCNLRHELIAYANDWRASPHGPQICPLSKCRRSLSRPHTFFAWTLSTPKPHAPSLPHPSLRQGLRAMRNAKNKPKITMNKWRKIKWDDEHQESRNPFSRAALFLAHFQQTSEEMTQRILEKNHSRDTFHFICSTCSSAHFPNTKKGASETKQKSKCLRWSCTRDLKVECCDFETSLCLILPPSAFIFKFCVLVPGSRSVESLGCAKCSFKIFHNVSHLVLQRNLQMGDGMSYSSKWKGVATGTASVRM